MLLIYYYLYLTSFSIFQEANTSLTAPKESSPIHLPQRPARNALKVSSVCQRTSQLGTLIRDTTLVPRDTTVQPELVVTGNHAHVVLTVPLPNCPSHHSVKNAILESTVVNSMQHQPQGIVMAGITVKEVLIYQIQLLPGTTRLCMETVLSYLTQVW